MQVTLSKEEIKNAIEFYICQKCVTEYHNWEIVNTELSHYENGNIDACVSIDKVDHLPAAPVSYAPMAPMEPVSCPTEVVKNR